MPGCHHSASAVIDKQAASGPAAERPRWGLINRNLWRSSYDKGGTLGLQILRVCEDYLDFQFG